jgi:hypothetical protein
VSKFESNVSNGVEAIEARIIAGLTVVGERIARNAAKTAEGFSSKPRTQTSRGRWTPVGRMTEGPFDIKQPGLHSNPEPIRVRAGDRGLSQRQKTYLRAIHGHHLTPGQPPEVVFRQALESGRRGGRKPIEVAAEFARLFTFRKGGGTPGLVVEHKGLLRGVRSVERTKPHLYETIHFEGVTKNGDVLTARVRAASDHANLVEFGFHHKGGGQIAGRPYLLPAFDAEVEGVKSGKAFKG